ncbi:MAG: Gldg family protein [Brevinemataceae bacterium]
MRQKLFVLAGCSVLSIIISILFYVLQGDKSIAFRVAFLLMIGIFVADTIVFRKYFLNSFKRGKFARLKLLESGAVLFFGIALLVLIKSFDWNVDWTEQGLFRFSSETKTIISELKTPVTITLFSYNDMEDPFTGTISYGRKLAERYQALNPNKVIFKEVDPIRNKMLAGDYGIRQNGTFVFEMNGKKEYVIPNILEEKFDNGDIQFKGETIFTSVIGKLKENKQTYIYYLSGQGEVDFSSGGASGYNLLETMLMDRGYEFKALNLLHHPEVPKETDLLIIADSRTELSSQVITSVDRYINNGGSVLYMVGPKTTEDLNILLFKSGFAYLQNIAIDPTLTSKSAGPLSIIPLLSPKSEITVQLRNKNLGVLFPTASLIELLTEEYWNTNYIYDINILAKISKNGFGERKIDSKIYQKDENDIEGVYSLGLSSITARKDDPKKQHRGVLIGSLDFVDNQRLNLGGNSQFFLNSVDFLLRKDLKTTVPAKSYLRSRSVPQSAQQTRLIFIFTMVWFVLWLAASLFVLIGRNNKIKRKS